MHSLNQKTCHLSSTNSPVLPALMTAIESRPLQPNPHHVRSVTSTASLAAVVAVCNPTKVFSVLASSSPSLETQSQKVLKPTSSSLFLDSKSQGDGEISTHSTRSERIGCEERSMNSCFSDSMISGTYFNKACSSQDKFKRTNKNRQRLGTLTGPSAFTSTATSPQPYDNASNGSPAIGNFRIKKTDHGRVPAGNTKQFTTSTTKGSPNIKTNAAFNNRPRPVNYNDLMRSEQTRLSSSLPDGTPKSSEPQRGLVLGSSFYVGPRSGTDPVAANEPSWSSGLAAQSAPHQRALQSTSNVGDAPSSVSFLEGPLPPAVRAMLETACASPVSITHYHESFAGVQGVSPGLGENGALVVQAPLAVEEAERQARRLLSTSRRLKVYREELQTAKAEFSDMQDLVQKDTLVRRALETELVDIDSTIARLMKERALCEAQFQQQDNLITRDSERLHKAEERVTVLNETIENMMQSTQADQLVLNRLVPNLNIENYI
ncbi:unnamed protein product [Phytomonas sp. Hart1]|nr:unnamed protein product [Phytomonas sp. Hart1]|eukprot:CCW66828.1 unnamed protein product [Phytomonas sp. isolate Hart1]